MDKCEKVYYKKVIDSYSINYYQDYNDIQDADSWFSSRTYPKYGRWVNIDKRDVSEKEFKDNYGNPKVEVNSSKHTVVIEEYQNKISLKLYSTFRVRSVGSNFFRVRRNLSFITYRSSRSILCMSIMLATYQISNRSISSYIIDLSIYN